MGVHPSSLLHHPSGPRPGPSLGLTESTKAVESTDNRFVFCSRHESSGLESSWGSSGRSAHKFHAHEHLAALRERFGTTVVLIYHLHIITPTKSPYVSKGGMHLPLPIPPHNSAVGSTKCATGQGPTSYIPPHLMGPSSSLLPSSASNSSNSLTLPSSSGKSHIGSTFNLELQLPFRCPPTRLIPTHLIPTGGWVGPTLPQMSLFHFMFRVWTVFLHLRWGLIGSHAGGFGVHTGSVVHIQPPRSFLCLFVF